MQLKSAVTIVLASVFSLSWSTNVLAEVKAKYDEFKDKTTVTVLGERQPNRPRLHVWHQSDGKRPDPKRSAEVGFLINQECVDPNFLADGKRVQPEAGSNSPTNPHIMTNDMSGDPDIENILGLFTFNFYNLPEIKQIATAKSVQYKLCDQVFTLSPQEQAELRKFLSYFKQ